jgi:hypothetical protein
MFLAVPGLGRHGQERVSGDPDEVGGKDLEGLGSGLHSNAVVEEVILEGGSDQMDTIHGRSNHHRDAVRILPLECGQDPFLTGNFWHCLFSSMGSPGKQMMFLINKFQSPNSNIKRNFGIQIEDRFGFEPWDRIFI